MSLIVVEQVSSLREVGFGACKMAFATTHTAFKQYAGACLEPPLDLKAQGECRNVSKRPERRAVTPACVIAHKS